MLLGLFNSIIGACPILQKWCIFAEFDTGEASKVRGPHNLQLFGHGIRTKSISNERTPNVGLLCFVTPCFTCLVLSMVAKC